MEALKNNSEIMRTIVETFLVEEVTALIYDNEQLDKWGNLVNELGLKGQSKLKAPDKSPVPFMPMKTGVMHIFQTLCPRSVDIKEFNVTPIPVEILDLVSLSLKENYFQRVEIWYDEKNPDPACIGVTANFIPIATGYNWYHDNPCKNSEEALAFLNSKGQEPYNKDGGYWSDEKYYLIGKWADVKHSLDELREMAIKRFCGEKQNEFEKQIKEAQRGLDDLKQTAFDRFN